MSRAREIWCAATRVALDIQLWASADVDCVGAKGGLVSGGVWGPDGALLTGIGTDLAVGESLWS